ncbi:MAG TPA: class I SAM-dependent methyltransferase [Spirochaetota bacterium]|nr:class I SAM-dependent methyltransferase [Spirochaetota bacterium]HPU90256.1 class I SAM-dependent methyltransferase [Spirochaetota bacterium]
MSGASAAFETRRDDCPLCGAVEISFLYAIDRFSTPFTVDRCGRCGFIFMNPRFTDAALASFYDKGYYTASAEYAYCDERAAERHARHVWNARLKTIRRHVSDGALLDVGCAFGGFLKAAQSRFRPYGIEISPYAAGECRRWLGDALHQGTLADHPFPSGYFSVITMIEVIEHLADPVFAIEECHRLLRPGGLLVLQTANFDARQARRIRERYAYFLPGHVSYFTKRNLSDALRRAGFSRIVAYQPVDFGLLPKLLKSRGGFRSIADYRAWFRIAWYHLQSTVRWNDFALTSSMVLYAIK